ncbi:hypothetical protein [Streptomyces sp. MK37H]|uniref:hypothetical protein n=1 Tax=Streptomyces sp. MK37H TaxID=2699117 RepID=UPI001B37F558|nr:hypothetical protein [Streptomyces sp. MK37H]MBP8534072.1 hypothetical protein [Streptomyces sp. MK37H]
MQDGGAVGDVAVGAGVADEGRDVGVEGGGALVELGEVLVGEGEFVVGAGRVGEGGDQGEESLGDSPLARSVVLFCFGPRGFEGGRGAVDIAVGPSDVGQDAVMAALPAQGGDGREGGGEITADAGEVGQTAVVAWSEPAACVDDLAHAARGGVGAAEVFVGLGPVVHGDFGEFAGEPAGVQDGGEAFGGAFAVLVLAAGDGGEELGQGVGGCVRPWLRLGAGGGAPRRSRRCRQRRRR